MSFTWNCTPTLELFLINVIIHVTFANLFSLEYFGKLIEYLAAVLGVTNTNVNNTQGTFEQALAPSRLMNLKLKAGFISCDFQI